MPRQQSMLFLPTTAAFLLCCVAICPVLIWGVCSRGWSRCAHTRWNIPVQRWH